jgi:hypothetical protein
LVGPFRTILNHRLQISQALPPIDSTYLWLKQHRECHFAHSRRCPKASN